MLNLVKSAIVERRGAARRVATWASAAGHAHGASSYDERARVVVCAGVRGTYTCILTRAARRPAHQYPGVADAAKKCPNLPRTDVGCFALTQCRLLLGAPRGRRGLRTPAAENHQALILVRHHLSPPRVPRCVRPARERACRGRPNPRPARAPHYARMRTAATRSTIVRRVGKLAAV